VTDIERLAVTLYYEARYWADFWAATSRVGSIQDAHDDNGTRYDTLRDAKDALLTAGLIKQCGGIIQTCPADSYFEDKPLVGEDGHSR